MLEIIKAHGILANATQDTFVSFVCLL